MHIGPHKTGTTAIQYTFHRNRRRLAAHGVSYPKEIGPRIYGHHWIADCLARRAGACSMQTLEQFVCRMAAGDSPVIVLSSENLASLSNDHVAQFALMLKPLFDTKVVYAIRDPISLMWSHWQEKVKHGETCSFSEYQAQQLQYARTSVVLEHSVVLDRYISAFGRETLRLINYNKCRHEGSLIEVFCSLLPADLPRLKMVRNPLNESLPVEDIEIIRALNQMGQRDGLERSRHLRIAYTRVCKRLRMRSTMVNLRAYFADHKVSLLPTSDIATVASASLAQVDDLVVNPPLVFKLEHAWEVARGNVFDTPEMLVYIERLYLQVTQQMQREVTLASAVRRLLGIVH